MWYFFFVYTIYWDSFCFPEYFEFFGTYRNSITQLKFFCYERKLKKFKNHSK